MRQNKAGKCKDSSLNKIPFTAIGMGGKRALLPSVWAVDQPMVPNSEISSGPILPRPGRARSPVGFLHSRLNRSPVVSDELNSSTL